MNERFSKDEQRWADIRHISDAVRGYVAAQAYLLTGGSTGCAACSDLTWLERVTAGHPNCAKEGLRAEAAEDMRGQIAQFDLDIAIAHALEDPRLFQWLTRAQTP